MKSMVFIIFLLSEALLAYSEENQINSPILFIIDASSSMLTQIDGKTRMQITLDLVSKSIDKLPENQRIGLLTYGNRKKEDCEDVEFLVDIDNINKKRVIDSLALLTPQGMAPLSYSISLAIDKLRKSKTRATIILFVNGLESCGGNICNVVKQAKKEGIEFRLHIIGFHLNINETKQLRCATTTGDGYYYDASDAKKLEESLNESLAHTIDNPQNNFTVYTVKNGEAIDALVNAYDLISKRNPISVRTYGDTASFYLPPSNYNFKVIPLDGSNIKMITIPNVQSFKGINVHHDISFVSEKIAITTTNNGKNWDCIVKVKTLSGNIVASIRTYQQTQELEVNPGVYDISIQALAMEGIDTHTEIKNVTVAKGVTPVSYDFKTGKLLLETFADEKPADCLVMVSEVSSGKNVLAQRTYGNKKEFLLTPGRYEIKVIPLGTYKNKELKFVPLDIVQNEMINKKVVFDVQELDN